MQLLLLLDLLTLIIRSDSQVIIPSNCQILERNSMSFDGNTRYYSIYLPQILCDTEMLTDFVATHTDWFQHNTNPFDPQSNQLTLPILTLYPGLTESGQTHWNRWQWFTESNAYNFITIIPEGGVNGNSLSWNAQSCCGNNRDQNVNDVGFVDALLDGIRQSLQQQYQFLDLSLENIIVYMSGHSNGGFMVDQLAWIQSAYINNDYNIPFTASIAISGYIYDPNLLDPTFAGTYQGKTQSSMPFPVFYIHGELDGVVDLDGCECPGVSCCCGIDTDGADYTCFPLESAYNSWLSWNNCDEAISWVSNNELIIGSGGEQKYCLFGYSDTTGCDVPTSMCWLVNTGHPIYSDSNVDFDGLKQDMTMFLLESSCLKQNGVWDKTINSCQCPGSSIDDSIYYCIPSSVTITNSPTLSTNNPSSAPVSSCCPVDSQCCSIDSDCCPNGEVFCLNGICRDKCGAFSNQVPCSNGNDCCSCKPMCRRNRNLCRRVRAGDCP